MTHPSVIQDELSRYSYNPEKCTETIEVELPEEDLLKLSLMAHERDITLNHLMCALLDQEVKRMQEEHGDDLGQDV